MIKLNKNKKILTLEDLEIFYSKYKRSTTFSSKKSGYQLAVQIPATFEVDNEYKDDTILFAKSRMFHIGVNRNHSNVTKDAAEKAMRTMAYKPLLANFAEFEDENGNTFTDFTSHDMVIENDKIKYLEHQIGCITADEPWFEDYEGKTYVCGYLAIPRDYTEAVDIIERKNGTKVSVELLVNELMYDAKSKELVLTDVVVSGLTCLGRNPETGEEVQEGMVNSRLDIKDFSKENNSIIEFSDMTEEDHSKLIDTLEKLNKTLSSISNFNINNDVNSSTKDYGKEEKNNVENEKLVNEEVTEAEEVEETETTETDNTVTETESTEEVTVENEEVTKVTEETVENNPEVVEVEEVETVEHTDDETETFEETKVTEGAEEVKNFSKTFELSHEDVRSALYALLAPVEEANNDWYWICQIYDNHFVYQGIMGNYWGQKYIKDNDNVAFDGERYELFAEFVTTSEKAELEKMRSNYSSIEAELNKYKEAENMADKMSIFEDESYSSYLDTEEFKQLMSEDNVKKFTKEELQEKADATLGKLVKKNKSFAFSAEKKDEKKKAPFFAFAKQETDTSFLDSLLKK